MVERSTLVVTLPDSDGDEPANGLTYGLLSGPAGVMVNRVTGVLTWTPGAGAEHEHDCGEGDQ